MHMSLGRRLQILIDDERHERITQLAAERGVSVATVVREAIDRGLAPAADRKRVAAQRILDAPAMPVPEDPADLLRELDELRGRRG